MSADRPEGLAAKVAAALDHLGRARRSERQAQATAHGLTPLQVELLAVIAAGAPPEPSVGLLATEVAVTQPTVTDSLRALTAKGLVERRPHPTDARRGTIRLTRTGKRVAADLDRASDALRAAIDALPRDSQEATLEALIAVIARLVASGAIDVARTCLTCRFHRDDGGSHRCELLQMKLPAADLRVNCPDHAAA